MKDHHPILVQIYGIFKASEKCASFFLKKRSQDYTNVITMYIISHYCSSTGRPGVT